jgi:hypothetical protein
VILNIAPLWSYYGTYNVELSDGGGNKMADACILGPIAATRMAMEVDNEVSWQDVPLFLLEHYRVADTSPTILVPGYKFTISRRFTVICDKMGILYPGISITKEVLWDFRILISPFCSCSWNYNVQSRDGGGNKMADACIVGPIAATKMAMDVGKDLN